MGWEPDYSDYDAFDEDSIIEFNGVGDFDEDGVCGVGVGD